MRLRGHEGAEKRAVKGAVKGEVHVVPAGASGTRLDKWLADAARLGSRARALEALTRGQVFLDEREVGVGDAGRRLAGGERVRLWLDRPGSARRRGPRRVRDLDILFEDGDVLVLAKPAGVLTVPLPAQPDAVTLAHLVAAYWRSHGKREALAVHRLDRDTSGLVVFARTPHAQAALRAQFASRTPEREYLAVVHGQPTPEAGTWRTWLRWDPAALVQRVVRPRARGAREAVADYRVVETFGSTSLLAVRLGSGRQHQIRVQAWQAGHPLVGERIYTGPPAPAPAVAIEFPRQALHGLRLAFDHPRTGERLAFEWPPPDDFRGLVARLRRTRPAR
jgi:23S rRNA pseudouridine1911/1915/1917 synthase